MGGGCRKGGSEGRGKGKIRDGGILILACFYLKLNLLTMTNPPDYVPEYVPIIYDNYIDHSLLLMITLFYYIYCF